MNYLCIYLEWMDVQIICKQVNSKLDIAYLVYETFNYQKSTILKRGNSSTSNIFFSCSRRKVYGHKNWKISTFMPWHMIMNEWVLFSFKNACLSVAQWPTQGILQIYYDNFNFKHFIMWENLFFLFYKFESAPCRRRPPDPLVFCA